MSKNNFYCPATKVHTKQKERMNVFLAFLNKYYPEPICELNHKNAFQLLAATILSAQCTDKRVNIVTPALFEAYPTPDELANADILDVEELVHTTGFYKNKAKNLVGMAANLTLYHDGNVPNSMEELIKLPGVGRKTANVILGNIFRVPGMVVDTHVIRISNRLKFAKGTDAEKIEKSLEKLVPKDRWIDYSHQVILLGRSLCPARSPKCDECPLINGFHI